jgi:hypothetical protein
MARHPEVSEKAIIQAGIELESAGKMPNPGAIRAYLGYRGGLMRIKSVWTVFTQKRDEKLIPEGNFELTIEALPAVYAENCSELMRRVNNALVQLILEAYQHSQQVFEKRIQSMEVSQQRALKSYQYAETDADKSVAKLEDEVDSLNKELSGLAEQNANLVIGNAELRGRIAALDEHFGDKVSQQSTT